MTSKSDERKDTQTVFEDDMRDERNTHTVWTSKMGDERKITHCFSMIRFRKEPTHTGGHFGPRPARGLRWVAEELIEAS